MGMLREAQGGGHSRQEDQVFVQRDELRALARDQGRVVAVGAACHDGYTKVGSRCYRDEHLEDKYGPEFKKMIDEGAIKFGAGAGKAWTTQGRRLASGQGLERRVERRVQFSSAASSAGAFASSFAGSLAGESVRRSESDFFPPLVRTGGCRRFAPTRST